MNTRLIAARTLVRVLDGGQSLTAALEHTLPALENPQDKAFVQAVCYGVCRYYHQLQFILMQLLDTPIKDAEIYALALVGLYQLAFMRVKTHAAVSETVDATRKKSWAKNLINALLRRYLREQEDLEKRANENPVALHSHPKWLISRLENDWGSENAARIFQANNQFPPMVLRVNCLQTSRENYLQQLADLSIEAEAVETCSSAIRLSKPVAVFSLPNFESGMVSVQDTAAQFAAGLLDLKAGQRVLDLCAAPAGKTAHILETQPDLECVAVDIDATRMLRVETNLQRLNLSAQLIVGDATKPESWWDGKLFDRILVDAPCSALGVIRRHPDIKILRRADDLVALPALQAAILNAAWSMLSEGGLLVYATCSILKTENEDQIAQFLTQHSNAQEIPFDKNPAQHGWQILTGDNNCDGFYYARLRKTISAA
ncbi:MAG: 16S rRNA (cytosine(967)-C(5))-methyltransferase RsmB [Methylococcales bacterium]|nr:16S rRNA (cytosine(967)-C(5))-methyltransferase RsmB [Methylococcales bacterium]